MLSRIVLGLAGGALLALSPGAHAGGQRTFVAAAGDDAQPCSLNQPCRSFAAAIAKTNAAGEVIVLDSAGYGPVTITKSVSLIAPPGVYAGVSVLSGDGITVNAPGATVVLRGLSINGQGGSVGVRFTAADRLRIESCIISGMGSAGVVQSAPHSEMIVQDTTVRDTQGLGIDVEGDGATTVLDHVRSEHNHFDGLRLYDIAGSSMVATVVGSAFTNNEGSGIETDGAMSVLVDSSAMSNNGQNGFVAIGVPGSPTLATATLAHSVFNDNIGSGVWVQNGGAAAFANAAHRNAIGFFADTQATIWLAANIAIANPAGNAYCAAPPAHVFGLGNNTFAFALSACFQPHGAN